MNDGKMHDPNYVLDRNGNTISLTRQGMRRLSGRQRVKLRKKLRREAKADARAIEARRLEDREGAATG